MLWSLFFYQKQQGKPLLCKNFIKVKKKTGLYNQAQGGQEIKEKTKNKKRKTSYKTAQGLERPASCYHSF
jgi:hypothetical protein